MLKIRDKQRERILRQSQLPGAARALASRGIIATGKVVTFFRQVCRQIPAPAKGCIGMNPQGDGKSRRKTAQKADSLPAGLVRVMAWGSVCLAGGNHDQTTSANLPIPTPTLIGQASKSCAGLSDFLYPANKLSDQQGFAQFCPGLQIRLCRPVISRHLPVFLNSKNQGWAGCRNPEYISRLRLGRVFSGFRPVAKQPANRRCTARVPDIWGRSLWMATRLSGLQPGRRAMCFIAREARATATRARNPSRYPIDRPLWGRNIHVQNAAVGHPARSGVLRLIALTSKDCPCSPRF